MNSLLRLIGVTVVLLSPANSMLAAVGIEASQVNAATRSMLLAQSESGEFEYEDFDFWVNQCLLLTEQQQYAEALTACEAAIALEPREDNVEVWSARGEALYALGRYTESIAAYQRVVEASANDSLAIAAQCAGLFQLNRYEDAIDTCEQALSVNGSWGNDSPAVAWYYRGLSLRQLGRLETALASFERAMSVDPAHVQSLAEQCETLTELQRSTELMATCRPEAAAAVGSAMADSANPADRSTVTERCGVLPDIDRPNPLAVRRGLQTANELMTNRGLAATVVCYERALADNAQDMTLWIQQGLALEQLGFYERALTAYSRAVALNPTHAIALVHQCGTLNQLQSYEAALESCDRALQGDSGLATWKAAYGWNQRSVALLGMGKYEEALAAANQAIEIEPRYAPAWNSRALSLWWLNQGDAAAAIEQAIVKYGQAETLLTETFERTYPDAPILIYRGYILALFNQGRILTASGNYADAVAAYDRALAMDKDLVTTSGISALDDAALANIWANQAAAYLYFEPSQALNSARNALILDGRSFAGWYNRGLALARLNNSLCAFDAYSQAGQISPGNLYVLTGQGIALAGLGLLPEAIAVFDQVLRLNPSSALAQQHRQAILDRLWAPETAENKQSGVPEVPIADCRADLTR